MLENADSCSKYNFSKVNVAAGESATKEDLRPRRVIKPGEVLRYKLFFEPRKCGKFSHTYTIEITGWNKKYSLHCSGQTDIPRLDMSPDVLFNNVLSRRPSNLFPHCVYYKKEETFDFGPRVVQENK